MLAKKLSEMRLHSSLGYMPPAEFIAAWKMQHQEKLS